jgi:hypothetical protein
MALRRYFCRSVEEDIASVTEVLREQLSTLRSAATQAEAAAEAAFAATVVAATNHRDALVARIRNESALKVTSLTSELSEATQLVR